MENTNKFKQWSLGVLLSIFATHAAAEGLTFGVFPYVSPGQLVEYHSPLKQYLSEVLGQPVSLLTAPGFPEFFERTRKGEYDISLTGPHIGRLGEQKYGYHRIAMTGHYTQGVLLVRKDSAIHSVADLRGKSIMMAEHVSILYQMGIQELLKAGLTPNKDIKVIETRTHNNAMFAPLRGDADASITGILLWQKLGQENKDQLRVIATTPLAPGFLLMAHDRLGKENLKKLRDAIMKFKETEAGKRYLETVGFKEFKPIDNPTMESLDKYTPALFESHE